MSVSPLITATPAVPPLILRGTATDQIIVNGPCRITYIRVNATTAGTVTLTDNTARTGTNIFGAAFNAPLGTAVINLPPGGILLKNGLYVQYTTFAGTVEVGVVRN